MNQLSDEQIAAKVQAGDTDSFGVLVERYEDKIIRYGRKFLSRSVDIEDLAQDIFIKAYANIMSFNIHLRFSPWLYRIAHNEFVNALRKNSRGFMSLFDFDAVFPHPLAKETADAQTNVLEIKNMIDRVLGQIDSKYREPLFLYYYEEMSYSEIAEILRIPTSTVGVRINRGKNMLRKAINQQVS